MCTKISNLKLTIWI